MGLGKECGPEQCTNIPLFEMFSYRPKETLERVKATVCLIDDRSEVVKPACEYLATHDYLALAFQVNPRTSFASTLGNRALAQAVLNQHPDLVICDIDLDSFNGIEVIEYIRRVSDDLVVTALWTGAGNARGIQMFAHHVIDKSNTADHFLAIVDQIVSSGKTI